MAGNPIWIALRQVASMSPAGASHENCVCTWRSAAGAMYRRLGGDRAAQLGLPRRLPRALRPVLLGDGDGRAGLQRPVQLQCVAPEAVGREHSDGDRALAWFDLPELVNLAAGQLRQPVEGDQR